MLPYDALHIPVEEISSIPVAYRHHLRKVYQRQLFILIDLITPK